MLVLLINIAISPLGLSVLSLPSSVDELESIPVALRRIEFVGFLVGEIEIPSDVVRYDGFRGRWREGRGRGGSGVRGSRFGRRRDGFRREDLEHSGVVSGETQGIG